MRLYEQNYTLTALISFGKDEISLFVNTDASDYAERHGLILMYVNILINALTLVRDGSEKTFVEQSLCDSKKSIMTASEAYKNAYKDFHNCDDLQINFNKENKGKRRIEATITFNAIDHKVKIGTKGFGILGRNVESSMLHAVFLFAEYLLQSDSLDYYQKINLPSIGRQCVARLKSEGGSMNIRLQGKLADEMAALYAPMSA